MSAEASSITSLGSGEVKKSSWAHDLRNAVIPSLVTAVFGFFIWNAQTEVQQSVDTGNQMLQTQMAMKEEFFKRRLMIYEEACKNVAGVKSALDNAGAAPENQTAAINKLEELDRLNKSNALYWSENLEKRLGTLWELGIDKVRYSKFADKASNDSIRTEIAAVHKQMKDDLAVEEMARLIREYRKQ